MFEYTRNITWSDFFTFLVVAIVAYLVLLALLTMLKSVISHDKTRHYIQKSQYFIKYFYWPIACVALVTIFVGINPIIHGIPVLLFILLGFNLLKNIFSGLYLKSTKLLRTESTYQIDERTGVLQKHGLTGADFSFPNGMRFIPYTQLLENGITTITKENSINSVKMEISFDEENSLTEKDIMNLLFRCPLVNWRKKPILSKTDESRIEVVALLREGSSDKEILSLLRNQSLNVNLIN